MDCGRASVYGSGFTSIGHSQRCKPGWRDTLPLTMLKKIARFGR